MHLFFVLVCSLNDCGKMRSTQIDKLSNCKIYEPTINNYMSKLFIKKTEKKLNLRRKEWEFPKLKKQNRNIT